MLNNLYRKLYILFSVSIMLIISLVIAFAVTTAVHSDRENESTMFQRMTTLLIYQLENSQSDMESTIQSYEDKYDLFVRLENSKGQEIYQSKFSFPTETDILLQEVLEQTKGQQMTPEGNNNSFTSQGGIYTLAGKEHDEYYAIPATIATTTNDEYSAVFMCHVSNLSVVLSQLLPALFTYMDIGSYRCPCFNTLPAKKGVCADRTCSKKSKRFCSYGFP